MNMKFKPVHYKKSCFNTSGLNPKLVNEFYQEKVTQLALDDSEVWRGDIIEPSRNLHASHGRTDVLWERHHEEEEE
tara:strand:+ start:327 stop:554 length:228 start_codon:yes stop_codon:yes gene_type:complete